MSARTICAAVMINAARAPSDESRRQEQRLVGSLVALLAWLRVAETREPRRGRSGSMRPVTLTGFVHQLRMLSGHTGFLLVCLIGMAGSCRAHGSRFQRHPANGERSTLAG